MTVLSGSVTYRLLKTQIQLHVPHGEGKCRMLVFHRLDRLSTGLFLLGPFMY